MRQTVKEAHKANALIRYSLSIPLGPAPSSKHASVAAEPSIIGIWPRVFAAAHHFDGEQSQAFETYRGAYVVDRRLAIISMGRSS
jgi:hypothetical protein